MIANAAALALAVLLAVPAAQAGRVDKLTGDERTINGQTVVLSEQILANVGEVTLLITAADGAGARVAASFRSQAVEFRNSNLFAVNVPVADADEIMKDLEENDHIIRVEFDSRLEAPPDEEGSARRLGSRRLSEDTPYGIEMVKEDLEFWNELPAPPGTAKICVVDTGYHNGHPDLPILDENDDNGFSPYAGENWYEDGHGHGSHCAGSIGATGGNDLGVVGVIPNIAESDAFSFFIGKGLTNSGSGSNAGVMAAVNECAEHGATVISMSLGGGGYSATSDEQYRKHYEDDNILIVAAAGNGGSSASMYPASYKHVMSVAAVDSSGSKASFSQYNDQVEIAGPGVGVNSCLPPDNYAAWSGTSMACPHVAAVGGLLRAYFPNCRAFQIRNAMIVTAEDRGAEGCDVEYGFGIVKAKAAYQYLEANPCDENTPHKEAVGGCAEFSCLEDSECDDNDENTSDQCVSGSCVHTFVCLSNGDCDDGDTCTYDECVNSVCVHEDHPRTVMVELTTDNYPAETSWDIKDAQDQVLAASSGYSSANTAHEERAYCTTGQEDKVVTFNIADTYGDGICCSYGSGGYTVKVDGVTQVSGGEFGQSETKEFTIPALGSTPPPTTLPPVTSPPTTPPTVASTPPPTKSPTSPTPPPVAGDGPGGAPAPISIDLFLLEFDFEAREGCVDMTDLEGHPGGAVPEQCAQACAVLSNCDGFVEFQEGSDEVGTCILSSEVATGDDCEDKTVWYYDRKTVMHLE